MFLNNWPNSNIIKNIVISNKLNVEPASIKSVEKTQGSHNLEELSNEILEVIFARLKSVIFLPDL